MSNQDNDLSVLKICYFGTYRAEYSRNRILISGLRRVGVEVFECHERLWYGIDDRVQIVNGGWKKPSFWIRVFTTYFKLLQRFRHIPKFDVLIVGYPGHFDIFLARILSWIVKKPLVWDVFMSIYLIALERNLDRNNPTIVKLLRKIEQRACRVPDLLIIDTIEYKKWFEKTHEILSNKFRIIPTGADDHIFRPQLKNPDLEKYFKILYYGTFIPNHGIPNIIEAANLLKDDQEIFFELIGDGPDKERAKKLTTKYSLDNVNFSDWVEKDLLVKRIANANLCLGSFGSTPQAKMTIQNKIYECLAMGKPIVSGYSDAVEKLFVHKEQIFLVERENPNALAEAIAYLKSEPSLCKKISKNGQHIFYEKYSSSAIGFLLKSYIIELAKAFKLQQ